MFRKKCTSSSCGSDKTLFARKRLPLLPELPLQGVEQANHLEQAVAGTAAAVRALPVRAPLTELMAPTADQTREYAAGRCLSGRERFT